MSRTRLFRHDDGKTSLAVIRGENHFKVATGPGFSSTITQIQGKKHKEITVTTARDTVAIVTTTIVSDGTTMQKHVLTKFAGNVTREDIFKAHQAGNFDRSTKWKYGNGTEIFATYGDGSRSLEITGPGGQHDTFKTTGSSGPGRVDSVTQGSDRTLLLPGDHEFGPGNVAGYVDPSGHYHHQVTRVDGSREEGIGNRSGSMYNEQTTQESYDVFNADGQRTGSGWTMTNHDSQRGHTSVASKETYSDGTTIISSAFSDGHGGMTTDVSIHKKNPDGSWSESETHTQTNADGSGERTTTETQPDGSKTVQTDTTTKDGNTTSKTESYNGNGEKTSSSDSGDDDDKNTKPDKSGGGYPNPEGSDDPPHPAWRGPADTVFTEYTNGLNAYLGGNRFSQGMLNIREYTPPIFNVLHAMKGEIATTGGVELANSVAVVEKSDVNISPEILVGALGRLAVLSRNHAGLKAAEMAAQKF